MSGTNKREIAFALSQHLNHLRTRWLAYANEAKQYQDLYEEANLFVQRAIQRLPEDHPLHPFNYDDLFSDDYARQLATVFEEQDAEEQRDPELDEVVGMDDLPVEDKIDQVISSEEGYPGQDTNVFDVSEYNKQVMKDAEEQGTTYREPI